MLVKYTCIWNSYLVLYARIVRVFVHLITHNHWLTCSPADTADTIVYIYLPPIFRKRITYLAKNDDIISTTRKSGARWCKVKSI